MSNTLNSFSLKIIGLLIVFTTLINAGCISDDDKVAKEKIDDWQYDVGADVADQLSNTGGGGFMAVSSKSSVASESMGFAVGGAKDVNNFRENIKNEYLPLPTDVTYEGIFYDYYFDTGESKKCKKLFCPSYATAVSADPFSKNKEYYLSVGLNSGIQESDFERKKLNLVVVLDISGSMSSSFNRYYYDRLGGKKEIEDSDEDAVKSKIEIAAKSIVALLDHLEDDDQFGMVLFDDGAYLAKSLLPVDETDIGAIKEHILELCSKGGTNMESGIKMGTDLFAELTEVDQEEYENRIIFLTDAMPNIGNINSTSETGLLGMTKQNSENKINTTFIGIGVDFNTELIESITKIRGANYYSVHSANEFKTRMDDEFEFMVTPLVFDLKLTLEAEGFKIKKVYGSPEADEATGEIMKVNTLFPSRTENGEVKGGMVLLKLEQTSDNPKLKLKTSYEDRSGEKGGDEQKIEFEDSNEDFFENTGIQKGILLSRYVNLVKNWILEERKNNQTPPLPEPTSFREKGILIPPHLPPQLGQWERQSMPLAVSQEYQKFFAEFKSYFENEIEEIDDNDLKKELEILEKLAGNRLDSPTSDVKDSGEGMWD